MSYKWLIWVIWDTALSFQLLICVIRVTEMSHMMIRVTDLCALSRVFSMLRHWGSCYFQQLKTEVALGDYLSMCFLTQWHINTTISGELPILGNHQPYNVSSSQLYTHFRMCLNRGKNESLHQNSQYMYETSCYMTVWLHLRLEYKNNWK